MLFNIFFMMVSANVVVRNIVVKGNARISKDVITSRISEEAFSNEEAYLSDYKALVGTGFFKNVRFEKCDNKIIVHVEEHPTINQIAFEGNKKMKDEQLAKITKKFNIESRRPFPLNATHLAPVIQAMKEEYRQMAVPVEITISTTPLSENRVNVIFNINEEPKMRIKEIRFEGLKAMKASALRGVMYTKKYNPIKFFSQDHFFLLERVEYDNRAISEHMRNHGYPNAKVSHTFVQVDPKHQDYRLIFYVEEGDKYTLGDINTEVERQDLPMDLIKKKIQVKKGQVYNFSSLRSSLFNVQDALSKRGFNTLDFDIAEKQDAEKKTIGITFKITKGKNITIRRIHIIGNTRTRHDVILDRIKIREGDRFNRLKTMEAQRNLENTGFFKEVKVEPTSVDEHAMDITIRVTEARTGSISFNLGYGTLQGMMASIGVTDQNIKGTGLLLQTGVSIADKEQNVSFGISNPRFLRRDLNGGFNLLYSRSTMYDQRVEKTVGGEVSLGYELSPWVHQDLSLGVRHETVEANEKTDENFQGMKFEEVASNFKKALGSKEEKNRLYKLFGIPDEKDQVSACLLALDKIRRRDRISALYKDDFGSYGVTEFGHGLTIRPPIFPIGFPGSLTFRVDNNVAGLLGNVSFLKNQVTASYQHRLGEYLNFLAQISYGLRSKIGNKELRITDCKVLGGQDFHGFDFSGVGPRDKTSKINVGGKEFYLGKVEMSVPLPILKDDLGARFGVYTEFGSCHNSRWKGTKFVDEIQNGEKNEIYDQNFCRVSVGCFIKLSTPFGPLRFDFAKPIRVLKDKEGNQLDEERVFMVGYAYQL